MPTTSRRLLWILLAVIIVAILGIGGWFVYQKYGTEKPKTTTDVVTPNMKEAYSSSLQAGLKYVVTSGDEQNNFAAQLDPACDKIAALVGAHYGEGRKVEFKTVYRSHYSMVVRYYQAVGNNDKAAMDKQANALALWAGDISELTPAVSGDNTRLKTLYTSYVNKIEEYVRASAAKSNTKKIESELSTIQEDTAEVVAAIVK